jgi:tRNA(fMet)-specific endonuclease VapC
VVERVHQAEGFAITIITRLEVLTGRIAWMFKAENGERLLQAQQFLVSDEQFLSELEIVRFDDKAAAQFDSLLKNKKIKKIGRGDLLTASIALAQRATLVTRNVKDFKQVPGFGH